MEKNLDIRKPRYSKQFILPLPKLHVPSLIYRGSTVHIQYSRFFVSLKRYFTLVFSRVLFNNPRDNPGNKLNILLISKEKCEVSCLPFNSILK